MPEINFSNSPRTEERVRRFNRGDIASGFYQKHNFVIVPALREDVDPQIQIVYPRELNYVPVKVEKYEQEWKRVEEKFWNEMDNYLPLARKLHEKVEVCVTRYGAVASQDGKVTRYFLREDRDIADLAAMIINSTLCEERSNLGITWTKREALMDFIMTRPAMRRLFPKFEPVFAGLSRIPSKIRRESEEYVRSLGIAPATQELEIAKVRGELTKKEIIILKLLIERRGDLVTYDELADVLWGEGEFRTFWAINKLVGRLRVRLAKLGVGGAEIKPVRGMGYCLNQ